MLQGRMVQCPSPPGLRGPQLKHRSSTPPLVQTLGRYSQLHSATRPSTKPAAPQSGWEHIIGDFQHRDEVDPYPVSPLQAHSQPSGGDDEDNMPTCRICHGEGSSKISTRKPKTNPSKGEPLDGFSHKAVLKTLNLHRGNLPKSLETELLLESGTESGTGDDRLFSPCLCRGSMRYVHVGCLSRWCLIFLTSTTQALSPNTPNVQTKKQQT